MLAKAAAATTASVHPGFFDPFLMGLLAKKKVGLAEHFAFVQIKNMETTTWISNKGNLLIFLI